MFDLNEYQRVVSEMPLYDDPILGLVGEVGELVEHVKKDRRPEERRKPINEEEEQLEIGDIFWYLTRYAHQRGYRVDTILQKNVEKLIKRHSNDRS